MQPQAYQPRLRLHTVLDCAAIVAAPWRGRARTCRPRLREEELVLPRVLVHTAVSVDGRAIGFDVDMGQFYGVVAEWGADCMLTGADTIVMAPEYVADEPAAPAPEVGPSSAHLLAVVDSRPGAQLAHAQGVHAVLARPAGAGQPRAAAESRQRARSTSGRAGRRWPPRPETMPRSGSTEERRRRPFGRRRRRRVDVAVDHTGGMLPGCPSCSGPMRNGRIISLSSCSTMWQCHTNCPFFLNWARMRVTSPG